jgi:hypothetical protein
VRWACQSIQAQPAYDPDGAAHGVAFDAVVAVAQFGRDGQGGGVVDEGPRGRRDRAQSGEGQVQHGGAHLGAEAVQHGGAHLGAEALVLVAVAEPGPGGHLPGDGELACPDVLGADHRAVGEHRQRQEPVVGCPGGPLVPVVLEQAAGPLGRFGVGPWGDEGHHLRVVDACCGQVRKGDQLVEGGQAQFQARGGQL